jgi:hypothetical protein
MPGHRLLRDLAALNEGLCGSSPSEEAGRRLASLADRVSESSKHGEVVLGLDQAELLG